MTTVVRQSRTLSDLAAGTADAVVLRQPGGQEVARSDRMHDMQASRSAIDNRCPGVFMPNRATIRRTLEQQPDVAVSGG